MLVYGWAALVKKRKKKVSLPCRGDKGNMGEDYGRHIWRLLRDADRPNGGGNPPLLILRMVTAFIRACGDSDNSNKERWQRNFLCWGQNRGKVFFFFYACVWGFFCFGLSIRDEFHNLRLDLWWKNVSINKGLGDKVTRVPVQQSTPSLFVASEIGKTC